MKQIIIVIIVIVSFCSCKQNIKESYDPSLPEMSVKPSDFEMIHDGKEVKLFTLINDNGMIVQVTNFGASIVSILLPDKDEEYIDVALGYNDIDGYIKDEIYLGCVIGRFANRISKGIFEIDGVMYQLEINSGDHTLHSGSAGFHKVVWDAIQSGDSIIMNYLSPDMEGGFPGELDISLIYVLTENNEIEMIYEAETTRKTIINLINHSYFNMAGEGNGDILGHYIKVNADYITTATKDLLMTGEFLPVENSPFDLREEVLIGEKINEDHEQIKNGGGYDHNFVLNKKYEGEMTFAASIRDSKTGIGLKVFTTEPGIHVYSGNFLDGSVIGKGGKPYNFRNGIALEAQQFPDSPNQPLFPSTILEPGERYYQKTIYKFIF